MREYKDFSVPTPDRIHLPHYSVNMKPKGEDSLKFMRKLTSKIKVEQRPQALMKQLKKGEIDKTVFVVGYSPGALKAGHILKNKIES